MLHAEKSIFTLGQTYFFEGECTCTVLSISTTGALEDVQLVLEEERRSKDEIMAGRVSIERKSKEFIENQQRKMEELNQAKVGYI